MSSIFWSATSLKDDLPTKWSIFLGEVKQRRENFIFLKTAQNFFHTRMEEVHKFTENFQLLLRLLFGFFKCAQGHSPSLLNCNRIFFHNLRKYIQRIFQIFFFKIQRTSLKLQFFFCGENHLQSRRSTRPPCERIKILHISSIFMPTV